VGQVSNLRRISNPPVQLKTKDGAIKNRAQVENLPHTAAAIANDSLQPV
jgi:hypothetical protein